MKCSETVNRNSGMSRWTNFQPCGREAVEDGLCKIHLKVRERRQASTDAYLARQERGERLASEAEEMSSRLGIDVRPHYNPHLGRHGDYTGDFIVPGDWLRAQ